MGRDLDWGATGQAPGFRWRNLAGHTHTHARTHCPSGGSLFLICSLLSGYECVCVCECICVSAQQMYITARYVSTARLPCPPPTLPTPLSGSSFHASAFYALPPRRVCAILLGVARKVLQPFPSEPPFRAADHNANASPRKEKRAFRAAK